MENKLGSFAWAMSNNGQLTWREKIKFIHHVMLPSTLNFLKIQFKFVDHVPEPIALSNIEIPDTPIIQEVIAELHQHADIALIHHSWRTYFWGAALGLTHRQDFDTEVLLTAALCHDLGLINQHQHTANCQCFTLKSALAFDEIAQKVQFSQEKIHVIKDAICLHMNAFVDEKNPPEVTLLQYGAACDVIGDQFLNLDLNYRHQVLTQYPRAGFNQKFKHLLKQEAKSVKNSRTALLNHLGLSMMIAMNPFDE